MLYLLIRWEILLLFLGLVLILMLNDVTNVDVFVFLCVWMCVFVCISLPAVVCTLHGD